MVVVVANFTIQGTVICKETNRGARRDVLGKVVYIHQKKKGTKYSSLGYPRKNGGRVRQGTIDDDLLGSSKEEIFKPSGNIIVNPIVFKFLIRL